MLGRHTNGGAPSNFDQMASFLHDLADTELSDYGIPKRERSYASRLVILAGIMLLHLHTLIISPNQIQLVIQFSCGIQKQATKSHIHFKEVTILANYLPFTK